MNIVLVDFDHEFEARFASAASAQEITINILKTDQELSPSVDEEADLYLLALQPGVNRFRRLRELKGRGKAAVIVVSDRPDHVDSVVALELGADDYLPKDCEPREFVACIRAVLRLRQSRSSEAISRRLEIDGLALNLGSREAHIDGVKIELTTSEFEILRILMDAAGRTVHRDELGRRLTRRENGRLERALDVHVSHLRQKLGERRHCIKTVRGTGYQFLAPSSIGAAEQRHDAAV